MGKFSKIGENILKTSAKPTSMSDFIQDAEHDAALRNTGTPEMSKNSPEDAVMHESAITSDTVREEFRLPTALSEKLAAAAYHGKTKKVRIVIAALEKYLEGPITPRR
jgi:hypothetical protein